MKKLTLLTLVTCTIFCLVACSGKDYSSTNSTSVEMSEASISPETKQANEDADNSMETPEKFEIPKKSQDSWVIIN